MGVCRRTPLTFDSEFPTLHDPETPTKYRDQLERIDANPKRMTSSALGADGEWQRFMTVEYRRKD